IDHPFCYTLAAMKLQDVKRMIALGFVLATLESIAHAEETPRGLNASEWNSIQREYERNRRNVMPVEGGHQARNARQHWTAQFDGLGFTMQPDSGTWIWGLQLEGYGRTGQEAAPPGNARVMAEKEHLTYDWLHGL